MPDNEKKPTQKNHRQLRKQLTRKSENRGPSERHTNKIFTMEKNMDLEKAEEETANDAQLL